MALPETVCIQPVEATDICDKERLEMAHQIHIAPQEGGVLLPMGTNEDLSLLDERVFERGGYHFTWLRGRVMNGMNTVVCFHECFLPDGSRWDAVNGNTGVYTGVWND